MSNDALVLATSTMIIHPREFFQFTILSNDKARTKLSGDRRKWCGSEGRRVK